MAIREISSKLICFSVIGEPVVFDDQIGAVRSAHSALKKE
jgi:hypothetical protein